MALSLANRGTWSGYVENFSFISGTDDLRLTIDVDASGDISGTVTLGGASAPPPATTPAVGWPAGYAYGTHAGLEYAEGYAYRTSAVRWQSLRLRTQLATNEAWNDWCVMQTPYRVPQDNTYFCVSLQSSVTLSPPCQTLGDAGAPNTIVDCGKLGLCVLEGCTCTSSGCAATELGANVFVDVALNGDKGDGSIRLVAWKNKAAGFYANHSSGNFAQPGPHAATPPPRAERTHSPPPAVATTSTTRA